jgi:hypothetical protein
MVSCILLAITDTTYLGEEYQKRRERKRKE